jgi:transglutaminase-like putative cysteine protease
VAWWAILLWGCSRPDPWAGAPSLARDPVRTEWWALSFAGRPIGWEEHRFGPGREVLRRRALAVASGERTAWLRTAAHVRCDDAGCDYALWSPGAPARTGRGRFDVPDVWWPASAGSTSILVESTGEIVETEVRVDADAARWATPSGEVEARRDPVGVARDALAQVTSGRFDAVRVGERPPDPPPVDVARLLAVRAPPLSELAAAGNPQGGPTLADPRLAHVGVFEVDGAERVVERPTWPELPSPDRERVRALVEAVADGVRDAWVPGRSAGGERRGDCTEHALALVEAARAAGFDARTAAGRVYVEGPDGAALVLHAWAEVRLGGRWVAADAALRQFPADAAHLRLGEWIPDVVARDGPVALRSLR